MENVQKLEDYAKERGQNVGFVVTRANKVTCGVDLTGNNRRAFGLAVVCKPDATDDECRDYASERLMLRLS
jgi:hypothetical protein